MESTKPLLEFMFIKTTLPSVPILAQALRQPLVTERLICRPHTDEDLASLHALRSQQDVMSWTPLGRADRDVDETRTKLALLLPPHDSETFRFAICLKSTGEYIGQGGSSRKSSLGWPAIGYMFRKEYWGQGFATEFVTAFLEAYWQLPRAEYEVQVDRENVVATGKEEEKAKELLVAVTVPENAASRRVLEKTGFKLARVWEEQDMRNPAAQVTLLGFTLQRPADPSASHSAGS